MEKVINIIISILALISLGIIAFFCCLINEYKRKYLEGKNEKSCYWVDIEVDDKGNIYSIEPTLEVFEGKKLIRRR